MEDGENLIEGKKKVYRELEKIEENIENERVIRKIE